MTKAERTRLVWSVSGASLLWMLLSGFLLFMVFGTEIANHGSTEIKDRMAAECQGSFKDRYDCKEAIIVESGRDTFWAVTWRFLLVIVPPTVASFWLSAYLRRHPVHFVEPRYADADADWKSRAKFHTQVQSPEQAAHELHVDDIAPLSSSGKHLINDIAPVDDWKKRAQDQINKAKHPGQ